jgi:ketosteroid isomerase-like protein
MSQENVEVVRSVFDAVARRDSARIFELYDPAVEVHAAPGSLGDQIGGNSWIGHEGMRGFDRDLREAFEDIETTCEELIEAGDRVVSVSWYRGRGRGSGVEVDGPRQFGVWTIRGGRVTSVFWYATRAEALEAVGLSE